MSRLNVAIVYVVAASSSTSTNTKVDLHSGAGLVGLSLVLAIEKFAPDVEFDVYESAAELSIAGAGVGMQPRTWLTIRELGLEDEVLKISGNGKLAKLSMIYRKADQQDAFTFNEAYTGDEKFATLHRSELQALFLSRIRARDRLHLGKRLLSYTDPAGPDGEIQLHFADGTSAVCDVLVGADGIKSRVRAALYTQLSDAAQAKGHKEEAEDLRSYITPVFSGLVVYRGVYKREFDDLPDEPRPLNASNLVMYCGKNRLVKQTGILQHIVAYPVMKHGVNLVNISAIVTTPERPGKIYRGPWTMDVSKEEARAIYAGFEPEVQELVEGTNCWSRWAINMLKDLPTYVHGSIALIGDAAHAMVPHQGAGAGQGFEDALMLGKLLGEQGVTRGTIRTALKVYDEMRRPVSQMVAALSYQSGNFQMFTVPELSDLTEEVSTSGKGITAEQFKWMAENLEQLKGWQKGPGVLREYEAGMQKLREELGAKTQGSPAQL
ncbi:FAD/NAD-P-binding domain-containing protein [Trametes elegans]|nr:FAD/NAD-P-binding domain-containing protein [Trametes elegans]